MLVLFPLLSLLTLALAESQEYENARIVHRYFHPLHAPDAPYTLRGTVRLGTSGASAVYQPVRQFNDLLKGLSNKDVSSEDPSWLYQVAFEHHGRLDMSSVKACHFTPESSEQLTIHISPRTRLPHAIDYSVFPVPSDGSCHTHSAHSWNITKTSITVKSARSPPSPIFREPPRLTAEGKIEEPLPEKTFLQKYWMYFAGFLLALILSGGAEEPKK